MDKNPDMTFNKKKEHNVISLFSGAMGLDLGVEKAGFTIRVCNEIDHYAAETIRRNSPVPVIEKDICQVSAEELLSAAGITREQVTMLIGGPPCQAFSTAGKQRGMADLRGNLLIQYLRILSEIRPPYFILENVRGLLSAKINAQLLDYSGYEGLENVKGGVLRFLTSEMGKLGYCVSYTLMNAANYGVPEKRERMVLIGHLGDRVPLPKPTHSEDGRCGTKPWVTLREAIGDLEDRADLRYIPLRPRSVPYLSKLKAGQNWRSLSPEDARAAMGKAYELSGGKTGFLRRLSFGQPSPTLVTQPTMPATLLCHPTRLRPLSVEEYARIQQFPGTWQFTGQLTNIYKQIGNAVPIGLGFAVANQIMRHINGQTSVEDETQNPIPYSRYRNTTDANTSAPAYLSDPHSNYDKKYE